MFTLQLTPRENSNQVEHGTTASTARPTTVNHRQMNVDTLVNTKRTGIEVMLTLI